MIASEIRALFAVAARPEVVSLAGGMPYISALPAWIICGCPTASPSRTGSGKAYDGWPA